MRINYTAIAIRKSGLFHTIQVEKWQERKKNTLEIGKIVENLLKMCKEWLKHGDIMMETLESGKRVVVISR